MMSMKISDHLLRKNIDLVRSAVDNKDKKLACSFAKNAVIIARMEARYYIERYKDLCDEVGAAYRSINKAKSAGITCILSDAWLNKLQAKSDIAHEIIYNYCSVAATALDLWQSCGGTLKELCNICNYDYQRLMSEIDPEDINKEFSYIVCDYNLDYKDIHDQEWYELDIDAPFSHLFREAICYAMTHTDKGREIVRDAAMEFFPDLMENAYYEIVDRDGNKRMVSADELCDYLGDD